MKKNILVNLGVATAMGIMSFGFIATIASAQRYDRGDYYERHYYSYRGNRG